MLVPHVGHQGLPRHRVAGVDGEPHEEVELLGTQIELGVAPPHAPGPGVDHEIGDGRGEGTDVDPSQLGADASEQLGELERLHHVVDRSGIEADDDVELFVARREHHDRGRRVGAVDRPADVEPVEIGKAEVEQHQVGRILRGGFDRGPTGADPRGRVPRSGERPQERRADALVVLDEQDPFARHGATVRGRTAASDPRRGSGANMAVPSPSVRLPLTAAIRTVDRVNERIRLGLLAVLVVAVAACSSSSPTASPTVPTVPTATDSATVASAAPTPSASGAPTIASVPPTERRSDDRLGGSGRRRSERTRPVQAGDIPDDQVFVPYAMPGQQFTVSVPEGWARTEQGDAVTFTDNYNSVTLQATSATSAPTVDTVRADGLADVSSDPTFRLVDVQPVSRTAGDGVLATYEIGSAPNPVTGRSTTLSVERYEFFHDPTVAILTLAGAKGADNVDPWRYVTDSLTWP